MKMFTSSCAPKRKRQITANFTGQCRIVGPQNGYRFTLTFSCHESVTSIFFLIYWAPGIIQIFGALKISLIFGTLLALHFVHLLL